MRLRVTPEEAIQMTFKQLLALGRFHRREIANAVGAVLSEESFYAFLALDDREQAQHLKDHLKVYKKYPETHPFIMACKAALAENRYAQRQIEELKKENLNLRVALEALEAKKKKKK